MKLINSAAYISLLFTAPAAFAIHGYHNNNCHISESVAHNYSFKLRTKHDWLEVNSKSDTDLFIEGHLVSPDTIVDQPKDDPNAIFSISKFTNVSEKKYDDGCWVGVTSTYEAVSIARYLPQNALDLGMQTGMEIPLSCESEDIDPVGPNCE